MRNRSLIAVRPDTVIDGINVVYMGTLEDALFGERAYTLPYEERAKVTAQWMRKNGAYYYSDERWHFDDDDRMYPGFSVEKGVRLAKQHGYRLLVAEDLS